MTLTREQMRKRQLMHLTRCSLDELFVAMAERRAPQPRHAIDVGFAVAVIEKDALPAVDHERPGVPDRRQIGIGVNQRFDVASSEIAEHGVTFARRSHDTRRAGPAVSKLSTRGRFKFGARRRKRDLLAVIGLYRRIEHLPLAHRKTTARALLQVHVNMILVIAIRARTEHSGEALTRVPSHPLAKVSCDMRVGQTNTPSVSQPDQADIESVRFAVLAELCADDIVAAPTMI